MLEKTPIRRSILDLSRLAWKFGSVPPRPWPSQTDGDTVYDLPDVNSWLPATVPGNVRSDLLALQHIPDPFLDNGAMASLWTETVDWWYRTHLPLNLEPGQRAFLELDGVDYLSTSWAGGLELGRHEGMFSRQVYELPSVLAAQPETDLAIRIWGSHALPRYQQASWEKAWGRIAALARGAFDPFDDRLATLKAPMHFGWDFSPRLRTMGIWDDARLVICRSVYLADLWVLATPLSLPADTGPARLQVRLTLNSDMAQRVFATLLIRPANFSGSSMPERASLTPERGSPRADSAAGAGHSHHSRFQHAIDLPRGRSQRSLQVELPSVQLWQPWERGFPHLYEITVILHNEDNQPLDSQTVRFGVRSVERRCTDDGQPWHFLVNGQPLFLRGANWVPVDALWGRARPESYQPLLQMARDAGLNFLRVWGGGGREKRAFYELCDQLGLLIWQEFPIACVFLDHLPRSRRYLNLLRQEATGIIQALRNHPSLLLWCGGNEFSPLRNRPAVDTLAQAVKVEDGQRPWVPASPGAGDAHHWHVWHGKAPLATYRDEPAPFVSEFGLQAVPAVASLSRFLDEDELWPPGGSWQRHKADLSKLTRYASWFRTGDARDAPLEEALASFVAASQRAQAAGLQILIEHVRRRKGTTGGLAVWQWNDPWPAISWSMIDYFQQPKLAYNMLKRTMQPLLVSMVYPLRRYHAGDQLQATFWVINDSSQAWSDCLLLILLDDTRLAELPCTVLASQARAVGTLCLNLPSIGLPLRLVLEWGNQVLAENVYNLYYHDAGSSPISAALRRRAVDLILR
jgi:beta-mannosidase